MTHDELLAKIDKLQNDAHNDVWLIHTDRCYGNCECDKEEARVTSVHKALCAVVELHKPFRSLCYGCSDEEEATGYPCPTIKAIEKELK